nr:agmatine deiminase family protein [Coxiella burnetii]
MEVVTLQQAKYPRSTEKDFFAGYINYYVCNGAVIMPQFGDIQADTTASKIIAELYPKREIVQLNVDNIYENGGGIHCVTNQQPQFTIK